MKEYYASPVKIFGYFALFCIIPGPVALGLALSENPFGVVIGVLLLVGCIYTIYV